MNLALGIVSDEISPDFQEAIRYGTEWGLSIYELRVLRTGRVPSVEPEEFREVLGLVKERGVTVTALSPGIFKHTLSKQREINAELNEALPRTIEMAGQLGTKLIIVFGFKREAGEPENRVNDWLEYMQKASVIASKAGITVAIENEPGFWCDSGFNTAALIRKVGMPNLGANWDPCNGYGTAEEPYPAGYEAVKKVIVNVHVKDTRKGSLIQCVPVGEGAIDWRGQMAAIVRDRIVNHVTIETHCLPLIENSKKNVDVLRSYLRQP
ncbi:MAG: sugar phosphate isomerase/epimerase family protein [Bacteroidota bacterium]